MIQKILRSQKGFTLIELLVAVGILAVLAGIAVPVVIRFAGSAQTTANAAELASVQTAVDALMQGQTPPWGSLANCALTTFPLTSTNGDMAAFPCNGSGEPALYPDYMRQATTKCNYTVTADGTVTQASCP